MSEKASQDPSKLDIREQIALIISATVGFIFTVGVMVMVIVWILTRASQAPREEMLVVGAMFIPALLCSIILFFEVLEVREKILQAFDNLKQQQGSSVAEHTPDL